MTETALEPCPFCKERLETARLGSNARHPDNDCYLTGQVIHVSRFDEWNSTRQEAAKPEPSEAMVERVARAMYEAQHLAGPLGDEPVEWGRGGFKTQIVAWQAAARAAIASLSPADDTLALLAEWWNESRRYIYDTTPDRREKQIERFKPRIDARLAKQEPRDDD